MLSQALLSGASGQLRNMATTGGNLLQRTRCPYFQDVTTPCNKSEPGTGCSATEGYHRYHAILGASPHCVAVHPSDMAVALAALDATVHVLGTDGERDLPVADLHRLPGDDPRRDTVLSHGDLITSVDLPAPLSTRSPTARSATAPPSRSRWCPSPPCSTCATAGPRRADRLRRGRAQTVARGRGRGRPTGRGTNRRTFGRAADAALAAAEPLPDNGFKVRLARGALVATLRGMSG